MFVLIFSKAITIYEYKSVKLKVPTYCPIKNTSKKFNYIYPLFKVNVKKCVIKRMKKIGKVVL